MEYDSHRKGTQYIHHKTSNQGPTTDPPVAATGARTYVANISNTTSKAPQPTKYSDQLLAARSRQSHNYQELTRTLKSIPLKPYLTSALLTQARSAGNE